MSEKLFCRSVFEHYRYIDATIGVDSGSWEDTNPEDDLLPPKGQVNLEKDAILFYIKDKHSETNENEKVKPLIHSRYEKSSVIPPGRYQDNQNQQEKTKSENSQESIQRMTNEELYMALNPEIDKDKYKILLDKLKSDKKAKYCMKFGCTNLARRKGLCAKHHSAKMRNPLFNPKHAYCYRFSIFSLPGDDSEDASMASECESEDDLDYSYPWNDETANHCDDIYYANGDEKVTGECIINGVNGKESDENQDSFVDTCDSVNIKSKCISYSCSGDIYCKKDSLCRKHYRIALLKQK